MRDHNRTHAEDENLPCDDKYTWDDDKPSDKHSHTPDGCQRLCSRSPEGLKCADEPEEQAIFAHRKEVTPSCDNVTPARSFTYHSPAQTECRHHQSCSPVRRPSSRFMDAVARRSTECYKGELRAARTASVECRRAAAAAASLSGDVEMPLVPMGNLIDLSDPAPLDKGKQKDRRRCRQGVGDEEWGRSGRMICVLFNNTGGHM
ncbi:hypothetical protein B0H14DRAFT_2605213 [Mycena olivaceomarginata]|nr:hypothetical protein B0H14DRAFT_2605213 [Mycena olivaceomarginata]